MPLLQITARVPNPKWHYSPYSSRGNSSSNNNHDNHGGHFDHLNVGLLIGDILVADLFLFGVALFYYRRREKERVLGNRGETYRRGYAFWKAFCFASGLWLPIWIVKRCCLREKKSEERQAQELLTRPRPSAQNDDIYGLSDRSTYDSYRQHATDNMYNPPAYNRDRLKAARQPPSRSPSPPPPYG
ncbi:hypothetical protein GGR57DRAFT_341488 [Xylariaceae sp. FL1272]|nr:hypothetical protein GGR57DRAFT_341488 [Xylariaceae sp. FL1272]